ncbi:cation:proton antiporter [Candidatus Microgenomates bacterium]|nr:cation:proton antiporter [Candidatus Microgenomates bacterium]
MPNPFLEIGAVLLLSTIFGVGVRLFRQPLILAYLFAGLLLSFLGFTKTLSQETIDLFSQFGIAFLLFMVGLELKIADLKQVGKAALFTGFGQIIFTFIAGFILTFILGFSVTASSYISISLTFSSTIIIVKLLSEKHDLSSLYGKITVGFLLVQDFVAILILIFLAGLADPKSLTIFSIPLLLAKVVIFFLILSFLSKRILPLLFKGVARNQELLFMAAISWCFLLASVSYLIGFSIEIGAFLAGISLSGLPYHFQISGRIKPLRDLFITLFFVGLGMQMVIDQSLSLLIPTIILSIFILIGNPLIMLLIMGLLGFRKRTSFLVAITIAQISEFSLILMAMGQRLGHVGSSEVSLVTLVGIVTITLSTYMILSGQKLYQKFEPYLDFFEREKPHEKRPSSEKPFENHVILIGCNRIGNDILEFLKKKEQNFVVLDFNPETIRWLEAQEVPCIFGDVSDEEILNHLNLGKAQIIISTVPDVEDNLALISKAKLKNSPAIILVTALYPEEEEELYKAGADYVILPHVLGGKHVAHLLSEHSANLEEYLYAKRNHSS